MEMWSKFKFKVLDGLFKSCVYLCSSIRFFITIFYLFNYLSISFFLFLESLSWILSWRVQGRCSFWHVEPDCRSWWCHMDDVISFFNKSSHVEETYVFVMPLSTYKYATTLTLLFIFNSHLNLNLYLKISIQRIKCSLLKTFYSQSSSANSRI